MKSNQLNLQQFAPAPILDFLFFSGAVLKGLVDQYFVFFSQTLYVNYTCHGTTSFGKKTNVLRESLVIYLVDIILSCSIMTEF